MFEQVLSCVFSDGTSNVPEEGSDEWLEWRRSMGAAMMHEPASLNYPADDMGGVPTAK